MKKLIYLISITAGLLSVSCRQEVNKAKSFPNVTTYSPGVGVTGDTITILGSTLEEAYVTVGGTKVSLVESSDVFLKFIVDEDFAPEKMNGFYDLSVGFDEFDTHDFSMPIVLNHIISFEDKQGWLSNVVGEVDEVLATGPSQILITDFDGSGVRLADATNLFDQTQLENQVQVTGTSDIVSSANLSQNNPLGNNFYRLTLSQLNQLGGSGHAGEVWTRSEVLNDRATEWPVSFIEYPNGPFEVLTSNAQLGEIFVNFLVYKNGSDKTIVYPYLYNDFLAGADQFRSNYDFDFVGGEKLPNGIGVNEWVWVSVPYNEFNDGFGFGRRMNGLDIQSLNKIKFGFAHLDKLDDQPEPASGDIQVYIDHIIITQGAPFYGHQR